MPWADHRAVKPPRTPLPAGWRCGLLLAFAAASLLGGPAAGRAGPPAWWRSLGEHDLLGAPLNPAGRWIVAVFIGQECPVSNASIPVLNRLAAEFGPKGFAFVGAYVDPTADAASLMAHAADYSIGFPVADDRGHALVRFAGATYTPEVVVFSGEGARLYSGRIDDRVGDLGVSRPAAAHEDLREVLAAIAAGSKGPFGERRGYGCAIPEAVRP